jgi:hypothetical protein
LTWTPLLLESFASELVPRPAESEFALAVPSTEVWASTRRRSPAVRVPLMVVIVEKSTFAVASVSTPLKRPPVFDLAIALFLTAETAEIVRLPTALICAEPFTSIELVLFAFAVALASPTATRPPPPFAADATTFACESVVIDTTFAERTAPPLIVIATVGWIEAVADPLVTATTPPPPPDAEEVTIPSPDGAPENPAVPTPSRRSVPSGSLIRSMITCCTPLPSDVRLLPSTANRCGPLSECGAVSGMAEPPEFAESWNEPRERFTTK